MVQKRSSATLLGALFVASLAATTAFADHNGKNHGGGGGGGKPGGNDGGDPATGVWENWMADDVEAAWNYGGGSYLGQNVTITVVDDFTSRDKIVGVLNGKITRKLHGDWTKHMASATAPAATMNEHDFNLTTQQVQCLIYVVTHAPFHLKFAQPLLLQLILQALLSDLYLGCNVR